MDPGSAAHRHSALKARVNALMALRGIRGNDNYLPIFFRQATKSVSICSSVAE
jgi:hypothetical protein